MPTYPIITPSPDGKINQMIDEDAVNNKVLKVAHYINLEPSEDASLGRLDVFDRSIMGDAKFKTECQKYFVDPMPTTKVLVVFTYDFFEANPPRIRRTVKQYPGTDQFYSVPGKPKVVACAIGTSATSRTGGEAL